MAGEKKLKLTKNAVTVLERRYLAKNEKGEVVESPEELFSRVAKNIALADKKYSDDADVDKAADEFYRLMTEFRFMPNSPTLMNAGRDLQQLSACFVLPVEDSMEGIFDTVKNAALIHKSGGGCVKEGTNIYSDKHGLTKIENIYKHMLDKGYEKQISDGAFKMDISGENLTTISYNKENKLFERDKIAAVWEYDIPEDEQFVIICENGTRVTSSRWHPFLIRKENEIIEKRADELGEGDSLLVTGDSIRDALKKDEYAYAAQIKVDENIGWLAGLTSVCGNYYEDGNLFTIELFGVKTNVVKKVSSIAKKFLGGVINSRLENSDRPGYFNCKVKLSREVAEKIKEDYRFGKALRKKISRKLIMADGFKMPPLSVILSFYAGMLDAANYGDDIVIEFSDCTESWLDDSLSLLSLIGIQGTRIKGKGIRISGYNAHRLLGLTRPYRTVYSVSDENKGGDIPSDNWKFTRIKDIQKGATGTKFYDFTVEKNNNYISGNYGLTVIHNTGFSFSRIRPSGDIVKTTGGIASGPISFIKVFNSSTEAVKQGGTRRGANMGILRVDHPDIMEFITCKNDNDNITNFNLSVGITEEFMKALEDRSEYDLINPRNNKKQGSLKAAKVFNLIVESAWANGEPGILFLDKINEDNPTPQLGPIESTNPCGEVPLLPYEACNLGSINLSTMVVDDKIQWDKLKDTIHTSIHFLDNVIDMNRFPLQKIEEMAKKNRKIGLGVMGFADLLIKLKIPYNSQEAVNMADKIMKFVNVESKKASAGLAQVRGEFPAFKGSKYDVKGGKKLRNATTTTIAPTGSISMIAGCSSGIEPLFAVCYIKNVLDNDILVESNPLFEEEVKVHGIYSEELMKNIAEEGSLKHLHDIPEDLKMLYVTSHDISAEWHIKIQGAFQKYTDNAVSKTVNLKKDATSDDVKEVYKLAYELGCKGVTVYRDGSRESQVLSTGKSKADKGKAGMDKVDSGMMGNGEKGEKGTIDSRKLEPRPRPAVLAGYTYKIQCGCGNIYVTINEDEHGVFEAFTSIGKSGGCAASQLEAVSRLASMLFRVGADEKAIKRQLRGIRCPNPSWHKGGIVTSCADALGIALEMHLEWKRNGTLEGFQAQKVKGFEALMGACPDCGGHMIFESGCARCLECGYSKCG